MNEEIKEKRLKFLEDTVNHYNCTNRGIKDGQCSYAGECAIGRHLSKELAEKLDYDPISSVSNVDIFDMLPEELRELGQKFLMDVQVLHDDGYKWTETGLSESGKEEYEELKTNHCYKINYEN